VAEQYGGHLELGNRDMTKCEARELPLCNMAPARKTDQPVSRPRSATTPDWSRESKQLFAWAPSRSLLASIRTYQRCRGSKSPWCISGKFVAVLRHRFWSVVTGADIPLKSRIAGGLELPYPNGVACAIARFRVNRCVKIPRAMVAPRRG
jgi:hypothetical protein